VAARAVTFEAGNKYSTSVGEKWAAGQTAIVAAAASGNCAAVGQYTVLSVSAAGKVTLDGSSISVTVQASGTNNGCTIARTREGSMTLNQYFHKAFVLEATEGSTFTWYTLQLDTKPHKVQRQSGTDPNKALVHEVTSCNDIGDAQATFSGAPTEFFADYTDRTRPSSACGSVEPASDYWVDVTVSQTIHIDLAKPPSCPTNAPWGGGQAKTWVASERHPRYPFNGIFRNQWMCADGSLQADCSPLAAVKHYELFDELIDEPSKMDGYLSTCGGWQRDATFRFGANNWNIPQYVYVYAHNDKDASSGASGANDVDHVALGGNERVDAGQTYYTTILRHYVETEDTLDNIGSSQYKFVQWNKHGAIYTYGNTERFPFGHDRAANQLSAGPHRWGCGYPNARDTVTHETYSDAVSACGDDALGPFVVAPQPTYAQLDETGYTTWGFSKYESIYGYGYFNHGVWSTAGCCSTAMGGAWGAPTGGIDTWGTQGGVGGTDSNTLGLEFRAKTTETAERYICSFHRPRTETVNTAGEVRVGLPCTEGVTGNAEPRPYDANGAFCTPTVLDVNQDNTAADVKHFCTPRFATSYQTYDDRFEDQTDRTTGVAMKFPPHDVPVRVVDNDQIGDQSSVAYPNCQQSQFVMFSDAEDPANTDSTGVDAQRSEWLLDYNCAEVASNDGGLAGGLPGYPVSSASGDAGIGSPVGGR
jgi:hypothetical protein